MSQLRKDVENLTQSQMDNILLLDKLRTVADCENKGFLCSIAPMDEIETLNSFFEMVKRREVK